MEETHATVRDGYLRICEEHRWLQAFPALDLQVHGEANVYEAGSAGLLAWRVGQRG